jgi:hypothetical protein
VFGVSSFWLNEIVAVTPPVRFENMLLHMKRKWKGDLECEGIRDPRMLRVGLLQPVLE